MIRPLDLILVGAMIASAVWTFQIKHEAELASEKVAGLQKKITLEKERINLLRADWALLTQPARLQELAKKFSDDLKLENLQPGQIVQLDELPDITPPDDPIGALASENEILDDQVTGSIKRPVE